MRPQLPLLCHFLAPAVVLLALPGAASADPVVLRNGSYLSGEASVRQGTTLFDTFYATWDDMFLPAAGPGSFSDGVTLVAAGAMLTATSYLTTNISATTFSAGGGTSASIQVGPSLDPASRLSAFPISQLVIEFTLDEPHTFAYTGHYTGSSEQASSGFGFTYSTGGTLYRVIDIGPNTTATISQFNESMFGSFFTEQFTSHSGTLEAGRYFLQARSSIRLDTANTADASYAVSLALAPIPEPATLMFVGTGLAGVIGCARRARRRRSQEVTDQPRGVA